VEIASLRRQLREGRPLLGSWLTPGSMVGAQYLASQDFDWLGVDLEEYPVAGGQAASVIDAIRSTPAMPLVRSRRGDASALNVAMASGAAGVFIPRVGTAAQAAALLAPFRTSSAEDVAHIIMIETERGFDHVEEILSTPGIDACFLVLGETSQSDSAGQCRDAVPGGVAAQLRSIVAACRARGIAPGIHVATARQAAARIAEGWQLVAVGSDGTPLVQDAGGSLREIRQAASRRHSNEMVRAQAYAAGCTLAAALELGGY